MSPSKQTWAKKYFGLLTLFILGTSLSFSSVSAQSVDGKRLVRTWSAPVKVNGGEETYRFDIYYDYSAGQAEQFVYGEDESLVEHKMLVGQPSLSSEELDELLAIVNADSEFASLMETNDAHALGGFVWTDEDGECVYPGSRCAQVDIMTKTMDRRIRYVVVDLMRSAIVYRDFNADNPDLQ